MRWRAGLLVLPIALFPCAAAPQTADIMDLPLRDIPHVHIAYYAVKGRTAFELGRAMIEKSPAQDEPTSSRHLGATEARLNAKWGTRRGPPCQLRSIEVTYEVTVTLPRPVDGARFSKPLRQQWDAFYAALQEHEKGHVAVTVRQAEQMQRALQAATCATARAVFQSESENLSRAHDDYDRQTDHGRTQGAYWRN